MPSDVTVRYNRAYPNRNLHSRGTEEYLNVSDTNTKGQRMLKHLQDDRTTRSGAFLGNPSIQRVIENSGASWHMHGDKGPMNLVSRTQFKLTVKAIVS